MGKKGGIQAMGCRAGSEKEGNKQCYCLFSAHSRGSFTLLMELLWLLWQVRLSEQSQRHHMWEVPPGSSCSLSYYSASLWGGRAFFLAAAVEAISSRWLQWGQRVRVSGRKTTWLPHQSSPLVSSTVFTRGPYRTSAYSNRALPPFVFHIPAPSSQSSHNYLTPPTPQSPSFF